MDPVTLIVTALAAGAASALQDGTAEAVKDAYGRLKGLVKRRFAGRSKAELVLAEHESARRYGRRRWLRSCLRLGPVLMLIWWQRRRR
jgi:hypothetical protein